MENLRQQLLAAIPQMMIYARSRVGHPDEANELVQESLERILRRIPALRNDVNMVAYGIRTVRNVQFDRYRTEGRYVQYNEDEFAERCATADVSPETIETLQAFRKLNENCQRLLGLLAEGYRYLDVSRMLSMSEGAVAGAISRCRKHFVKLLKGDL